MRLKRGYIQLILRKINANAQRNANAIPLANKIKEVRT